MASRYSFDPGENAVNLLKHGLSLSEADGVLSDPLAVTIENGDAAGERGWVTIGTNVFGACRVVIWTARDDSIRFISVRRPDASEQRSYEEGV
jgi:uncharacterized DUF497 family protein